MKFRVVAGLLAAGLFAVPGLFATDKKPRTKPPDPDMRRAIAFERYKDLAAARQARKEARHPSVTYSNADRSADREAEHDGNRVKDPGPRH